MPDEELVSQCILVVDDELANVLLLERLLKRAGFGNVHSTTDSRQFITLFRQVSPDVVLLDLFMPYIDGFAILKQLMSESDGGAFLPRLVLTADISSSVKHRALDLGATDFLTKPFDSTELLLRVKNALRTRLLSIAEQNQNQLLEERVRQRTHQLEVAQLEVVDRLVRLAALKDDDTHEHTQRVGLLSAQLAGAVGMSTHEVELIGLTAPLHDLGKVGIPDSILLKQASLTAAEYEEMKSHTERGARILANGQSDLIQMAQQIALTHHERWDGQGYPIGLKCEEIPLAGRIVAIVDVFDALTHARPYKPAWSLQRAVNELEAMSGRYFDPDIADTFVRLIQRGKKSAA